LKIGAFEATRFSTSTRNKELFYIVKVKEEVKLKLQAMEAYRVVRC
jgi:hypothetical protein